MRLAISVKNQSTKKEMVDNLVIHKLPLRCTSTYSGASSILRRFSYGEPNQQIGKQKTKTILLMGETGSGKTTWINAMINYVLGVEWDDPFRFLLVDEQVRGASQAHSQTQTVTAYDIPYKEGFRIPFSLTIVDTPGFGDTGGMGRDKEITSAIQEFFENSNGIQELDAVGFVVQSALVRLTSSQKYIFNSVLSIFGKDIETNILFLVTFADGNSPLVLEAIKEAKIPCLMDRNGSPCHHSFNNGAIYKSTQSANSKRFRMDWEDGMENFDSFFKELTKMDSQSLRTTQQVLNDRKELETNLKWLKSAKTNYLIKTEELRMKEEFVELQRERIEANQNFEIKVSVYKKVRAYLSQTSALNCNNCETTCHHPCDPDLALRWCPAFYDSVPTLLSPFALIVNTIVNNNCEVCSGGCHPDDHEHNNYKWEYKYVDETQIIESMRTNYKDAIEKKETAKALVDAMKRAANELKYNIYQAMDKITLICNRLEMIALTSNPLSTPEYVQLLINKEMKEHNSGYAERINYLKELMELAKLARDIVENREEFVRQFKLRDKIKI